MTTGRGIAVTGLGMITPAGDGVTPTWRRVCAGPPTAATDPVLKGLPVDFACRLPADAEVDRGIKGRALWRTGLAGRVAAAAATDAVRDAGHDSAGWAADRVGAVLGCGIGDLGLWREQTERLHAEGPHAVSPLSMPKALVNMPAGEVAIALGVRGPSLGAATACASGATAIALARGLLLSGACDIVLAGGVEMAVDPLAVVSFHQMKALSTRCDRPAAASCPFSPERDGFVVSEGAAVLVLERIADARARGARIRAVLAGAGLSTDAHHPTVPHPHGAGTEVALRAALADAGVQPGDVDHVNAHATSTPLGDLAEATMISRVLPHGPSVTAAKGVLGHTLGAAGAIEAALTVLSIEEGLVPPIANLDEPDRDMKIDCVIGEPRAQRVETAVSNSFGFGGHNVSLVFTRSDG